MGPLERNKHAPDPYEKTLMVLPSKPLPIWMISEVRFVYLQ